MRSTLSGAMRAVSSALRLSEIEADGAIAQRHVVGVGDAHVLELELDLAGLAQAQGDVLDGDADAGKLLGDGALDRLDRGRRPRSARAAGGRRGGRPRPGTGRRRWRRSWRTAAGRRTIGRRGRAYAGARTRGHTLGGRRRRSVWPLDPRSWSHRSLAPRVVLERQSASTQPRNRRSSAATAPLP